jgi:hypothetical protein
MSNQDPPDIGAYLMKCRDNFGRTADGAKSITACPFCGHQGFAVWESAPRQMFEGIELVCESCMRAARLVPTEPAARDTPMPYMAIQTRGAPPPEYLREVIPWLQ